MLLSRADWSEALLDGLTPSDRDQFLFDSLLATFGYRLTPAGRGIFFVGKPRRAVGYRPPLKVVEAREQAHQMLADRWSSARLVRPASRRAQ